VHRDDHREPLPSLVLNALVILVVDRGTFVASGAYETLLHTSLCTRSCGTPSR